MFQNLDIPGPTRRVFPSRFDEEDYTDQFGSAEQEAEYDLSNNVAGKGRNGKNHVPITENENESLISPPSARGTHVSFPENEVVAAPPLAPKPAGSGVASNLVTTFLIRFFMQIYLRLRIV